MRVLVTGGTGFIGSHTVRELREADHDVKLLVRNEDKARALWADSPEVLEDLVVGKITSGPATVEALRDCDGVIHTAAPVALAVSRSEARRIANENLRSVKLLIERAVEDGIEHIVHLSTTALFDTSGCTVANESTPIHEKGDSYAQSKSLPERHVRMLQDRGGPISIVYPPSVIGPDDPGMSEGMLGIQQFLSSSVVTTSSGFQIVDVRDLALTHKLLVERPPAPGRYITASRCMDWTEFAELLDRAAGIRLPRMKMPGQLLRTLGRVGDALRNVMDIDAALSREATRMATQWVAFDGERTETELGIKFRDPVETLYDTVRWLAAKGHIPADRAIRFTHHGRGRDSGIA